MARIDFCPEFLESTTFIHFFGEDYPEQQH